MCRAGDKSQWQNPRIRGGLQLRNRSTMAKELAGKRVAILVADGFEQAEARHARRTEQAPAA